MGKSKGRLPRATATLGLAALVLAGCVGPGAAQTGHSVAPIGSIYEPDPARGPCGDALAMDVRQAQVVGGKLACTAVPLASGSPWPVTIRAAAQAFRNFTGEGSLQFAVSGPFDDARGREYSLNSASVDANGFFVSGTVDSASGRVTSVNFTPRAVDGPGTREITRESALAAATAYASTHSIDLAGLASFVEPTEFGWETTWERVVGATGLPPRVVITVNWSSGNVVSFSESRLDLGAPPTPAMTQSQAEAAAMNTWLASPVVEDARLRYQAVAAGISVLVWEIYISGKGDRTDGPTFLTMRFDAITGQPA